MKIYVFGGEKDACIELANQLNASGSTALIGSNEDPRDVSSKIGKSIDCAVMISEDPIKTVVEANRDPRIRAAVCYNQKTLKAAASEDVNMFILEPEMIEKLDFTVLSGGGSKEAFVPPKPSAPKSGGLFGGASKPTVSSPKQKPLQEERQPAKKKAVPPEEDAAPRRKGGGDIKDRIKDIFGIEE